MRISDKFGKGMGRGNVPAVANEDDLLDRGLLCVLHCVLPCVLPCVLQYVLRCVLQCALQCVLQCFLGSRLWSHCA